MIWELGTGPELWAEEFPRAAPSLRILDRDQVKLVQYADRLMILMLGKYLISEISSCRL